MYKQNIFSFWTVESVITVFAVCRVSSAITSTKTHVLEGFKSLSGKKIVWVIK